MAKKLLIKTPQTTDGTTLAYEGKQPIIKETIVELTAKKQFESLNASLPEHLQHEFEEVEVDDKTGKIVKAETAAKNADKK